MRLVLAALGRPLTVIVALIAIIAGFFMAIGRMRMDIFPEVGNPVIYVAQPYGGMTPAQMEGFPYLLLRVPLPLHHRHSSGRQQERPGRCSDEAHLP